MDRLEELRAQLEALDKEVLRLVESRYELVSDIKKEKESRNLPKLQNAEFERKLKALQEITQNGKLDATDVEKLYSLLHDIAIKWQS